MATIQEKPQVTIKDGKGSQFGIPEYKSVSFVQGMRVQTCAEPDMFFKLAKFLNTHCKVHLTIVILTKCTL
jgi:hypothetical protein